MNTNHFKNILVLIPLLASIGIFAWLDPMAQDPGYHQFVDNRSLWGIPNTLNVLTNMPFVGVGIWGIIQVFRPGFAVVQRQSYLLFFIAITLTGLGSGYYHWAPANDTLVWDRLPMAMAFMAFVSIVITDSLDERLGKKLLWPLIVLGLSAVTYWYISEIFGQGDLRPYLLVQFVPLIWLPVILWRASGETAKTATFWWVLAIYVFAKVCELADEALYLFFVGISGHSLKHLAAAIAPWLLLRRLEKERFSPPPDGFKN